MASESDASLLPVVSASRSRDLVNGCPELLAAMLRGDAPVRLGRYEPPSRLEADRIGVLVLWTKNPSNLLGCAPLRDFLAASAASGRPLSSLQLTVTGFGTTPVEPGIPAWRQVVADLGSLLKAELFLPEAVTWRFDPVGTVALSDDVILTNRDLSLFRAIGQAMSSLGVRRCTASEMDATHYSFVGDRLATHGARIEPAPDIVAFSRALDGEATALGLSYATCVNPDDPELTSRAGCIDGRHLNPLLGRHPGAPSRRRITEVLHNRLGRQRRRCACTFSRDIGYSAGVRRCFPLGFGCLYCFSQAGAVSRPLRAEVERRIERVRTDPIGEAERSPPLRQVLRVRGERVVG